MSPRLRQGGRVAALHGIAFQVVGHNRDGRRGLLGRLERRRSDRQEHRHWEPDQLGDEGREVLGVPHGMAVLNGDMLAHQVAHVP